MVLVAIDGIDRRRRPFQGWRCRDFVRSINDLEAHERAFDDAGSVCGLLKFFAMEIFIDRLALKRSCFVPLLILMLCTAPHPLHAQAPYSPGDICTRRAGLGAAGISYARPGTATGRFS